MSRLSRRIAQYGAETSRDNRIIKTTIHGVGSITTTAGGAIANVFKLDPNSLASSEFSSDFASAYDQFRVMGCRLRLVPVLPNSTTALNNMLVAAFDNDDVTALTSYSNGLQFSSSIATTAVFTSTNGYTFTRTWWRPTSGTDTPIDWIDCNSPSNSLGSIKLYADTLTASTTYLTYEVELYCEFRGRR